jgi:quercetin dioxygenase-like cupin family protein
MEWVSGNVLIRPNKMEKTGDVIHGHTHNFDHTTILFRGAFRIKAKLANGTEIVREAKAPAHFLIRADVEHEITALSDDTEFWCVYAHRTPQGDVIQTYDGWQKAYV